jgi:hypothetical protein
MFHMLEGAIAPLARQTAEYVRGEQSGTVSLSPIGAPTGKKPVD